MKKEPFLTDFPLNIFASSARKIQASLRKLRESISSNSLSGYSVLFNDIISPDFLHQNDPTLRNRHYGCIPVFWAWVSQILEGNASCSKAVSMMQSWCYSQGLNIPSSDTSSYCKGRVRLPDSFIKKASLKVQRHLTNSITDSDRWHGMTLKAIDGSSVKLSDTEKNQLQFPQPNTQKAGCGFPVMGITGLLNLSHGGWDAFTTATLQTHDAVMAWDLMEHIESGDLLLADRAYCSFAYIAKLLEKGAHSLMRLHQKREAALDWKKGKRVSSFERIVSWKRPEFRNQQKGLSREEWEALPQQLSIRLIRLGYEDRTGQKKTMTIATTLTDYNKFDGIQLHNLYARRWEIELKLRDIKTTMGFEMMKVKSPEMAIKTLLMVQLAYNLIRSLMVKSAKNNDIDKEVISFKESLEFTLTMIPLFRVHFNKPRKLKALKSFLIETLSTKLIKIRPYRSEPRAVKRRPKPYALLNKHRHEFVEIAHRSNYRAPA